MLLQVTPVLGVHTTQQRVVLVGSHICTYLLENDDCLQFVLLGAEHVLVQTMQTVWHVKMKISTGSLQISLQAVLVFQQVNAIEPP